MNKKLILVVMALCSAPALWAQEEVDSLALDVQTEQAFTFTEAQLGSDDDVTQNVTVVSSNRNVYASEVGYRFSPARFKYRAFGSKYNDIYINGNPVNDVERGEFRYSFVGGLNNQTRSQESALPFEDNNFSMAGMGGSNNYNFRPSSMSTGQRASIAGANRNYTVRAMYTYNTGILPSGWAFTGSLTYRWANRGYVEGTFYNSLSYFLGAEKLLDDHHRLSLVTWGNPTERGAQSASTDEMYWIANNNFYNPNWGYQDGKVRNSRVVKDFSPAALLTWDWNIDHETKLVTTLLGKYSMYSSSRLNYNNSTNPAPDYYSLMPSYFYDVWEPFYGDRGSVALANWQTAYDYLKASKANRQINFDRLYYANRMANIQGTDAMYYIQRYHDDQLSLSLASYLDKQLNRTTSLHAGLQLSANKGMHYQTMDDLLGANVFHNVNTYALGNYAEGSNEVMYDLNNPNGVVKEGDRFGYDYNLLARRGVLWANYSENFGPLHYSVSGKINYDGMQRDGKMKNGMFAEYSYGKSKTAHFVSGGGKFNSNLNLGGGNTILLGIGYEHRAPQITTAFVSPEMNNDFVTNLHNERIFSSEIGYQFMNSLLHVNINAYYNYLSHVTEWQNFYFDDINSFSYVSMTDIKKRYYGVEAGVTVKVSSSFNIQAIGTISEAENINNAKVRYMNSTKAIYTDDIVMNKGMHEASTPLTAGSIILDYHANGWFIDLKGNYYDRIYLSYSPSYRYVGTLTTMATGDPNIVNNDGTFNVPEQSKGKGGFMLDGSLGKTLRLKKGKQLSINLSLTNILNNIKICTGGYEQSRSDYTVKDENGQTTVNNVRAYKFSLNPKKYYAYGINGMLNLTLRF